MLRRNVLIGAGASLSAPRFARAQKSTTLKFVPYADLALADPNFTNNFVSRTHGLIIFDTLYGLDEAFKVQPQMLAGHTVEADGLLWRLTLREGQTFHDGSPVLARDAVASLRRWGARDSFGGALFSATAELSAPSDTVIQFRLNRRFPLLPEALAKVTPFLPVIMPERLALTPANVQLKEIVGSGPYRFSTDERVPGSLAVYRRFEAYRPRTEGVGSFTAGPRVAHFDRVEWHTIPDGATAASALMAGEVDWVEQPNVDLVQRLGRNPAVRIDVVETQGLIAQVRLNHLQKPFDNPAICAALLGAVDQRVMMDAVAGTNPAVRRGPVAVFTPQSPSDSEEGMGVLTGPRDLAASRRALADAGYSGEPVRLLAGSDVPRINAVCEVMGDLCRKLGLNLDYVSTDWGTVTQRLLNDKPVDQGGWSLYGLFSGGLDCMSPASHLLVRGVGRSGVPSWLTSAKLEELRGEWFAARDEEGRARASRAIQGEVLRVGAYLPCGQFVPPTAYRANLTDVARGLPIFTGLRRA